MSLDTSNFLAAYSPVYHCTSCMSRVISTSNWYKVVAARLTLSLVARSFKSSVAMPRPKYLTSTLHRKVTCATGLLLPSKGWSRCICRTCDNSFLVSSTAASESASCEMRTKWACLERGHPEQYFNFFVGGSTVLSFSSST